jgi:hypothetical protein
MTETAVYEASHMNSFSKWMTIQKDFNAVKNSQRM